MKLIDKNKLLEELKELKQNLSASPIVVIEDVESLVESLEVKEVKEKDDKIYERYYLSEPELKYVELKKELNDFIEEQKAWVKDDKVVEYNNGDSFNHIYDLEEIARHFYELGLKATKNRR